MTTPHRFPRTVALACALALAASACSDAADPTGLGEIPDRVLAKGGTRGPPDGKGGGGNDNGGGSATTEPFDGSALPGGWVAFEGLLVNRRDWYRADNVTVHDGSVWLTTPGGTYEGAELQSSERYGPGAFEARLRTSAGLGSITAFFLYDFYDEIDIEIVRRQPGPGGSTAYFVTWIRVRDPVTGQYTYQQTHLDTAVLDFDPATGFHTYRIEVDRRRDRVRFFVDGGQLAQFRGDIPLSDMHVMANTWWPTWVPAIQPDQDVSAEIDYISY